MAKIVGNLTPEDDYTHPLGEEENFNESVYFNFFDRAQNRGGFVRIGNRANEGYAEMTVIVWNPDGSAKTRGAPWRDTDSRPTGRGCSCKPWARSWPPTTAAPTCGTPTRPMPFAKQ